jgi:hypothetical protein
MNPQTLVRIALTQLAYYHQNIAAYRSYADTADTTKQAGRYYRKALWLKTKGLVEHDRILTKGLE